MKKQTIFHLSLIAVFACLAMSPAFYNGMPSGNDLPQHLQFADTVYHSIKAGEIYPGFAAAPNFGYGDVGLRFYPPLAYYVLSCLFLVIGNWFYAALSMCVLVFFVGGAGVYFWAKEEFPANQALLAAAVFIFAPYHLNQIYNNFLFAEFAASAIVPFCFLFITRVCRTGKLADTTGLALSCSLLLLTHLPSTIIASMVFSIYALNLLSKKSVAQTLFKLFGAVLSAIAATAFYWLKMVSEMNWINHSSENYFLNIYDYRHNFLWTTQNVLNAADDSSALWLADLMLLAIFLISIPSMIFLFKTGRNITRFNRACALAFFVSVLMTTSSSKFIWDNLSILQKVQFPWRWLGITGAVGAVFASDGIMRASEAMKRNQSLTRAAGLGFVLVIFIFTGAFITKSGVFLTSDKFNGQMKEIGAAQSFECWWTVWAKNKAFQTRERISAGDREYEITEWSNLERKINVAAGESSEMRVATFYYPHWKATVNGQPTELRLAEDGTMLMALPSERANIEMRFQEPPLVRLASCISIVAWLTFLFAGLFIFLKANIFHASHLDTEVRLSDRIKT